MLIVTSTLLRLLEASVGGVHHLKDFDVGPCPDDVYEVMEANGADVGFKQTTFPVAKLQNMVQLGQPRERERVDQLKHAILSPEGFIARLIIRPDGEVVEGQHRAQALIELNFDLAPVVIIYAPGDLIPDFDALLDAFPKNLRQEHKRQLAKHMLEILFEGDKVEEYDPPPGLEQAWEAARVEIERQLTLQT